MLEIKIKLPDNFLKEEVRYGYTVTTKMKKVWAIELDLLQNLLDICKKYNLSFCMGGGSLLGAIRHKGFIPWDDDIDVYMLRSDYSILMKHADEFKSPYFLQNTYTERSFFRTHAQLRNSSTTAMLKSDLGRKYNQGIFLDIFPLDGVELDTSASIKQQKDMDNFQTKLSAYQSYISIKNLIQIGVIVNPKQLLRVLFNRLRYFEKRTELMKEFENLCSQFSNPETLLWGNRTLVFMSPKSRRPYKEWKDLTFVDFEFLKVPIPRSYDEMLTQQYGDYMKPAKAPSMHGGFAILDPERSYKKYILVERAKIRQEINNRRISKIKNLLNIG